jgi:hypothetical protein
MPAKSTYLANKVLDQHFGLTEFDPPATVYIALYTSAPTAAGGGTEVSGGAYARAAIANNAANFPAAAAGSKSNGTAVTFAQATAAWGTVVAVGIFDALTNGNLLYFATLTTPRTVASSDTVSFPIGSLVISEN